MLIFLFNWLCLLALIALIATPFVLYHGMKTLANEVRLLGYRDIEDDDPDDPDPLEEELPEDPEDPEDLIETDRMKVH